MEHSPDADGGCPVLSYEFRGQVREQVCEFNLKVPAVGEMVPIIVHPETGEIFVTRFTDRWALSAILLLCILVLVALSLLSP